MLDNKLRCLLIQDDEADKSCAALDVHVGCSLDPKPLYGVAHFLEHMLFMGTASFPEENGWNKHLARRGGSDNGETEGEHVRL